MPRKYSWVTQPLLEIIQKQSQTRRQFESRLFTAQSRSFYDTLEGGGGVCHPKFPPGISSRGQGGTWGGGGGILSNISTRCEQQEGGGSHQTFFTWYQQQGKGGGTWEGGVTQHFPPGVSSREEGGLSPTFSKSCQTLAGCISVTMYIISFNDLLSFLQNGGHT